MLYKNICYYACDKIDSNSYSYFIEGLIVMILVIGSNVLAYISYKSYMKRKQEFTANNRSAEIEKRKQAKNERMNKKLTILFSF